jgi:hypothetical protein
MLAIKITIPATSRSIPITRLAAYQIDSSERVFVVRNPDKLFGGTISRIKGILTTMKTIPAIDQSNGCGGLFRNNLNIISFQIDTGESKFASRASTHLPASFLRMESVCPARFIEGGPPGGVTTTSSFVHIYAQSPRTRIS